MGNACVRIGFIITKFPPITGGGETHIELVARQMSKRGHHVEVITGFHADRVVSRFPYTVHQVHNLSDKSIDFSAVASIAFILGSAKYDILHIVNYEALFYFGFAEPTVGFAAKRVFSTANTPMVGARVFDGIGLYDIEKRDVQRALSTLNIDRYIANSEAFLNGYADIRIPRQDTSLIRFGIDLTLFTPGVAENRMSGKEVNILCTSRFIARKGIEYLLGALDYLPSNYRLYLTGSGSVHNQEAHDRLTGLAHRYGDRVVLSPKTVDLKSLVELYRSADVFVMPSRFEGFGLTALEAMACGTPVVATNVQGLNEFVRDGETGLLVDYGNSKQIAQALQLLTRDAGLRQRLTHNSLTMSRAHYNVSRMIDEYEQTYLSVAKTPARIPA
jgi:glycosyltransferase involved in cell wall biosynthesis